MSGRASHSAGADLLEHEHRGAIFRRLEMTSDRSILCKSSNGANQLNTHAVAITSGCGRNAGSFPPRLLATRWTRSENIKQIGTFRRLFPLCWGDNRYPQPPSLHANLLASRPVTKLPGGTPPIWPSVFGRRSLGEMPDPSPARLPAIGAKGVLCPDREITISEQNTYAQPCVGENAGALDFAGVMPRSIPLNGPKRPGGRVGVGGKTDALEKIDIVVLFRAGPEKPVH
jgi:hypothetical protein